jgi:putative flippase GtrA
VRVRAARQLYSRFQVLVHEMAKFGVVGAINTIVHFGLANLLHLRMGVGEMTANGIAVAAAATSSYFMNRHWTFRHRARSGGGREYSLFFLLNGVGLVISSACVGFTKFVLGLSGPLAYNAALVAGVVLGMGFRFATYKRWVFLPSQATPGGTGTPVAAQPDLPPGSGAAQVRPVRSLGDRRPSRASLAAAEPSEESARASAGSGW